MTLNVVSTFSGTGGSSLGYKMAGCKVLASLEFIPIAAQCYKLNFPDTKIIEKDIRNVTGKEILDLIGLKKGELDVLDGSPPCASFSVAGVREKNWGEVKNYSSTRQRVDDLFDEQIRLISEIKPKAIIMENVKGMTIGIAKDLLQNYIVKIRKLGYDVTCEVLNSKYFETATARERLFIMGIRKDLKLKPKLPKPYCKPITFREATKKIKLTKNEIDYLFDKIKNSKMVNEAMKYTKPGESCMKNHPKQHYFTKRKIHLDLPLPTITTVYQDIYHPDNRYLAIKEIKVCSSFPNSFKLIGTYAEQYERIGRAVPPNLMKHIALALRKILE